MSMKIQFQILRRTGTVSLARLERGVIYEKEHEYEGGYAGKVTSYLQGCAGSINEFLIDVFVDGALKQSHSGCEWLNYKWDDEWNKIRAGDITLENRQYQ